ncbi:diacylglycerol kinase [Chitinibacter fontanus]|uniref:Diacylglycerol kinase n=1 Tax=Chitinibacter fontanus TaxID=1737446 RepID=A0A7D5VAI4_9NEIS|nr:diacylglycerol kinase [Chitinibacter fontanus]QLI81473.1 diacylglycerol kinase [Chitinibacter fontanus]
MTESPFKGKTGIKRVFNALGYSIDGLIAGWQNEAAFRQVLLLAVAGIPIALFLPVPIWGKALLIGSHLACVIVELLNSAVEAAVDHTSLEKHHLAKRAKDLGSAAQLIGLINLTAMWVLVLLA